MGLGAMIKERRPVASSSSITHGTRAWARARQFSVFPSSHRQYAPCGSPTLRRANHSTSSFPSRMLQRCAVGTHARTRALYRDSKSSFGTGARGGMSASPRTRTRKSVHAQLCELLTHGHKMTWLGGALLKTRPASAQASCFYYHRLRRTVRVVTLRPKGAADFPMSSLTIPVLGLRPKILPPRAY